MVLWLFCLPHDFSACGASCVSFSLSLINCQSSSLSPSVSVLLSIFLLILCSILEEREGRKKPHRLNNPVFIRDLFRFFLCTVPPLIVAASSGFFFLFFFFFDFPRPILSLSRRYVRYSRPSHREGRGKRIVRSHFNEQNPARYVPAGMKISKCYTTLTVVMNEINRMHDRTTHLTYIQNGHRKNWILELYYPLSLIYMFPLEELHKKILSLFGSMTLRQRI